MNLKNLVLGLAALLALGADRVFDRRNVFARNTTTSHFIDKLHARTRLARLEHHFHFSKLARTARLLLVRVETIGDLAEGFAEADLRFAHHGFDAELGAHAVDCDFEVKFAHAAQHGLAEIGRAHV